MRDFCHYPLSYLTTATLCTIQVSV